MSSTIRPILGSEGPAFGTGGGGVVDEVVSAAVARHLAELRSPL